MNSFYTILCTGIGLGVVSSIGYLLTLACAASIRRRPRDKTARRETGEERFSGSLPRISVVVPAHDEKLVLAATLESLLVQEYPTSLFEIVVVADNCTDSTAQIARDYQVTVLERFNAKERGKGYALDWAISQLLARVQAPDAVVIVDADTWVAPDFLKIMATELEGCKDGNGCCAIQGRYGVLNATEGWRSSLMAGAFDLVNHVRPLGADRLGLSVALKGNGMAFTREVLLRARWKGHSITEDMDYGLDLIRLRIRVRYVPEALVLAQMPVTAGQAASQRERWEGGRYRLLRERALPILKEGLLRHNLPVFDAGIALLIPPLAELVALLLLWGGLIVFGSARHLLFGPVAFAAAFALSLGGFLTYVFGGLWISGAPREVYRSLFKAPFYIVWKLALYVSGFVQRRRSASGAQQEWIRTGRVAMSSSPTVQPQSDFTSEEKPGL
jgi:1,2-diacylglycerol 3-beta-glucosyltransferase